MNELKLKKRKDRAIPYTFQIMRSKWGLKRHHMNPHYMYAVPINSAAKRFKKGNAFSGTWFSIIEGKLRTTRAPEVWVGKP